MTSRLCCLSATSSQSCVVSSRTAIKLWDQCAVALQGMGADVFVWQSWTIIRPTSGITRMMLGGRGRAEGVV